MNKSLKVLLIVFGIIVAIGGFFLFLNYRSSSDNFYIGFKDLNKINNSINLEPAKEQIKEFHLVKQDKWKIIKSTDTDFEIKIKDDKNKNSEICLVLKEGKDTGKYSDKNLYTKDGLKETVKKEKDKVSNKDSYCFTCPEGYCKLGEHSTIFEWITDNLEVRDLNNQLVAEYERVENTDECLVDCYTVFKATLYTDNSIFDGYDFVNINNYDTEVNYNVYLLKDKWRLNTKDNYTQSCSIQFVNGTNQNICNYVNNPYEINETYSEYEPYNNEEVNSGEYYIKIAGKKKPSVSVDLSVSAFGISTDEFRNYWTWWNSSFGYKREIQIKEMSGVTQKNYQVRLNITYDSDMQSDYDDLRFADSTDTIEYDYFIYNSTSSRAIVDVEIPQLNASANTTIYMYYGNPTATNKSNGTNTYVFFENFETCTLGDACGWVAYNGNQGLVGGDSGDSYEGTKYFYTNDTLSALSQNHYKLLNGVYSNGRITLMAKRKTGTSAGMIYFRNSNSSLGDWLFADVSLTPSTYTRYTFDFNVSDKYRETIDDTAGSWGNFNTAGDVGNIFLGSFSSQIVKVYWDTIAVSNFTYPEPINTIGTEQLNNQVPQIYITEPINNSNYSMNYNIITFVYNATDDTGLLNLTGWIMNTTGTYFLFGTKNTTSNQLNLSLEVGGGLDDGRWWFWANATDKNNEVNTSENRTFFVDSSTPEFTYIPSNATLTYGSTSLNVNFTINDTNQTTSIVGIGINQINVNDSRFTINSSGWLNNNTKVNAGVHELNISVNDSLNNLNWLIYKVTINKMNNYAVFYINGVAGHTSVIYPGTINASAYCKEGDVTLYRDFVDITTENNQDILLGADLYVYEASCPETENYSAVASDVNVRVNQTSSQVNTYINNSRSNLTLSSSDSIYLNGSKVTGEGNIYLYNNGTLINSGLTNLSNLTLFSNPGMYNISTIYQNTQNYTESIETFWLNFTDTEPPVITNLADLTAYINNPYSYTFTATDDSGVSNFWLNDTTKFNINDSGYFYNISSLSITGIYYLMVSVNDTLNNVANYNFSTTVTVSGGTTINPTLNQCLYKKFGYYNLNLPHFQDLDCV